MNDDMRWWEHPERPCKNREEYADTTLVRGRGRKAVLADMALSCRYCPVLTLCATEVLAIGGNPPKEQVRAGVVYR